MSYIDIKDPVACLKATKKQPLHDWEAFILARDVLPYWIERACELEALCCVRAQEFAVIDAARELVAYEVRTHSTSRYVKNLHDALKRLDRSDIDAD